MSIKDPEVLADKLLVNVVTKVLLNSHSTAIFGILQRYEGNVMLWVRPTNNKLIDRAARYVLYCVGRTLSGMSAAERGGMEVPTYEAVCRKIYQLRDELQPDQPIVLHATKFFLRNN